MLDDLADDQRAALEAIVAGPLPWTRAEDLERAGHGPALEDLERLGLVEVWDVPHVGKRRLDDEDDTGWGEVLGLLDFRPGRVWTLTPLGAELDGRELGERGADEVPRWRYRGQPEPVAEVRSEKLQRGIDARRRERFRQLKHPELIVDKRPGPELVLDEETGEPVKLFGGPFGLTGIAIRRDRRIRPPRKGGPRGKQARAG